MAEHWTEEAAYDSEIAPLMTQIIDACKRHQIPMVASFQYADTEEDGPMFCTSAVPATRQCDAMAELNRVIDRHATGGLCETLAETIETMPDGKQRITIRRV